MQKNKLLINKTVSSFILTLTFASLNSMENSQDTVKEIDKINAREDQEVQELIRELENFNTHNPTKSQNNTDTVEYRKELLKKIELAAKKKNINRLTLLTTEWAALNLEKNLEKIALITKMEDKLRIKCL